MAADRIADKLHGAEEETGLFPAVLPSWTVRCTAWLIVGLFFVSLVGSLVVPVPEVVQAPFVLMPASGSDPVQSPVAGVVQGVLVQEGQGIRGGQTLFLIRSHEIIDRATELRSTERDLASYQAQKQTLAVEAETQQSADQAEIRRLEIKREQLGRELLQAKKRQQLAKEHHENSVRTQQSDIERLEREVSFRKKNLEASQGILQSMESLRREGLLPPIQLLNHQLTVSGAALDLDTSERELQKARMTFQQMQSDRKNQIGEELLEVERRESDCGENQAALDKSQLEARGRRAVSEQRRRELEAQIQKAEYRISALKQALPDSQQNLWRVTAPYDGSVVRLARRNPGDVVQQGQELCQLAQENADLRAELTVPEEAVSKLRPGQPVKLQLNAFPYQRFGAQRGVLRWTSAAAVNSDREKSFRSVAELAEPYVSVGGRREHLRAGMQGRGLIVVGRRTLFEFVLEPVRSLRESMRAPEGEKTPKAGHQKGT